MIKKERLLTGNLPTFVSITIDGTTSATTGINQWGYETFVEAKEVDQTIEFIYKQEKLITYTGIYYGPSPTVRIFKIVYSCKDGKWNKSEPIYGKIIPASDESYSF